MNRRQPRIGQRHLHTPNTLDDVKDWQAWLVRAVGAGALPEREAKLVLAATNALRETLGQIELASLQRQIDELRRQRAGDDG